MPNVLTFEVGSNTGRAKDEIISLLEQAKGKASEAARSFNELKTASIDASAAVSTQSNKIKELQTWLAKGKSELSATKDQLSFYRKEVSTTNAELSKYTKQLAGVQKQRETNPSNNLATYEKALQQQIALTTDKLNQRKSVLTDLEAKSYTQRQQNGIFVNGLINERQKLGDLTAAQQKNNQEKQKSAQASQNAEAKVRSHKQELKSLEQQEKANERQTKQLTTAQLAAATAVGYTLYNAFRRVLSAGSNFIEDAVVYAARTDEMRIAMLGMGEASGHTRGELLAQEDSIKNLNITTQEARQTLVKFQLAQLDISKSAALARAAQDLGVIAGVETGEELDRLVHGITTLQTRVLRTAGVNLTLIDSYKKVAQETGRSVASFSAEEKQAIALNRVIDYASRGTGLYGISLENAGKRMRSMTRLFQEMENAVGGLLQGPFGNLVDTLSGLLTLIAYAPKVFAALFVVFTAFGIQLFKNAATTSTFIAQLRTLIASLYEATKATVGFTGATTTNATAIEASAVTANTARLSWAGVATAMGGILKMAGYIAVAMLAVNVVLSATAEISKALGGTTKFLNPETANLSDLSKAKNTYKEINDELERRIKLGRADEQGRGIGVRSALERFGESVAGPLGLSSLGGFDQQTSEALAKQRQELQDDIDKTNAKLGIGKTVIEQVSAIQREYDEQLEKGAKANLDFSGTTEFVSGRLEQLKTQLDALSQPLDKNTGFTLSWAERLNVLSPEILALDTVLQKSSASQEDYNNRIAEAENRFPGFTEALIQLRSQSEKYVMGVGEAAGTANRHLIDVQRRLNETRQEISDLLTGSGRAGGLELEQKRLEIVKQEIDTINTARINLNRDVGRPISSDREERLSLQNVYETAIKVRDEVRATQRANKDFISEVVKAQQLASFARRDAVTAELTAAKMIADNQVKRVQDERQLTAEIIALSKQRIEQTNDEAVTQKQAFGSFYKEQLDNLVRLEEGNRRLLAQEQFNRGTSIGGLLIPSFAGVETKLENIAVPAASQAENVATITTQVQEINAKMSLLDTLGKGVNSALMQQVDRSPNGPWSLEVLNQYKTWKALQPNGPADWGDVGTGGRTSSVVNSLLAAAKTYGVDPNLVLRVAQQESGKSQYDKYGNIKTSSAGALGVMQLMPGTAARFGANPNDTEQNINAGVKYLSELLKMFGGNVQLALAGYNAGEFIKGAKGGGTIEQRAHRLNSLIEKNKDVRGYVGAIAGITSPRLAIGTNGTSFQQTSSEYIAALSDAQLTSLTRKRAIERERLNASNQSSYAGSNEYKLNAAGLRVAISDEELASYKKNVDEMKLIDNRYNSGYYESVTHRQQVTAAADLLRKKSYILTHDALLTLIEDESQRETESTRRRASEIEAAEIRARQAYTASRDALGATLDDQENKQRNYQRYLDTIHNTGENSRIRFSQDAEDKYNSIIEEGNSHWRDSIDFRLAQWRNFESSRIDATNKANDELSQLNYDIAHATDLDPQKIEAARLKAILSEKQADGEAKASMAANAEILANAQIYHADRANAKILDYLAKQRSVDDIVSDARIATMEKIFGAIDSGLGRVTSKLGAFGDIVKDIISGFARIALSKVFMTLFGISPIGTPSQQQPNTTLGILNGIIGGFGTNRGMGGTIGPGGTPTFSGGPVGGGISQIYQQLIGGRLGGGPNVNGIIGSGLFTDYGQNGVGLPSQSARVGGGQLGGGIGAATQNLLKGKLSLGNLAQSFGPMLPFMGAGFGAQLGGGGFGSLIGGVGGLALGGSAAALLGGATIGGGFTGALGSTGLFASTGLFGGAGPAIAGFLTNPFTIGAGVALLAAAVILKKNKARRAAENQRNQILGDAKTQLSTLLNQVQRDKIGVDEALAQAATIRAQYITSSQALPDKKTRNIALATVRELDAIITQIKVAGVSQSKRQQLNSQLVPEFAGGAFIVPGINRGYDSVSAMLTPGEMILNQQQQRAVGYANLARANVPSYAANRNYSGGGIARSNFQGNNNEEMKIIIVTDEKYAERLVTSTRDKILRMTAEDVNDKGRVYTAVRKVGKI